MIDACMQLFANDFQDKTAASCHAEIIHSNFYKKKVNELEEFRPVITLAT
uniref:Uncharacterized protein n=1 Tax=Kalanchoe fedtschenkoi TaxID=63787 RepID=A0A7N0UES6_KALFE